MTCLPGRELALTPALGVTEVVQSRLRSMSLSRRVPGEFIALAMALAVAAGTFVATHPSAGRPAEPDAVRETAETRGPAPTLAAAPHRRRAAPAEGAHTAPATPDDLALASADVAADRFVEARARLEAYRAAHPGREATDGEGFTSILAEFGRRRATYFSSRALAEFRTRLMASVRSRLADPSLAFNDFQTWMRRDCGEEAFRGLAEAFQRKDPLVAVEEAKTFLEARPRDEASWSIVGYGRATGLVDPSAPGGAPSRDAWWGGSTTDERADFAVAAFVEKAGVFECVRERAGNVLLVRWR